MKNPDESKQFFRMSIVIKNGNTLSLLLKVFAQDNPSVLLEFDCATITFYGIDKKGNFYRKLAVPNDLIESYDAVRALVEGKQKILSQNKFIISARLRRPSKWAGQNKIKEK